MLPAASAPMFPGLVVLAVTRAVWSGKTFATDVGSAPVSRIFSPMLESPGGTVGADVVNVPVAPGPACRVLLAAPDTPGARGRSVKLYSPAYGGVHWPKSSFSLAVPGASAVIVFV